MSLDKFFSRMLILAFLAAYAISEAQTQPRKIIVPPLYNNYIGQSQVIDDPSVVSYSVVDQKPAFKGGNVALYKWIRENTKFPERVDVDSFEGQVMVQFVVEPDGSISTMRARVPLRPEFDKEAVLMVKNMPAWIPGRHKGKPVRVGCVIPVTFKR